MASIYMYVGESSFRINLLLVESAKFLKNQVPLLSKMKIDLGTLFVILAVLLNFIGK